MTWNRYNLDLTKNPPCDSPHLNAGQLLGPILPLVSAALFFMLYVTNDPGDCNVGFLEFALVAGCISLFTVIIGLACKIMVEDAWADGTLSRKENTVVWLMINSHYAMLLSQVIMFFAFFIYAALTHRNITYRDMNSVNYCAIHISQSTYGISAVCFASSLYATLYIIAVWVFTRKGGLKDDSIQLEEVIVSPASSPATRSSPSAGFRASPERPRSIRSMDTSSSDDNIQLEEVIVSPASSPATRSSPSAGFQASPERPRSIRSMDTSSSDDSGRPVP